MTETVRLDGSSLTTADVAAVALRGSPVELTDAARAANQAARETIALRLAGGETVYGASTGVGALRDRRLSPGKRGRLQWNLLRSHAVTAGPVLAPEVVRAGMVVRANQLGAGGAGVAPELHDRLVAALNGGVVPVVRALGSLGTGDLPALAEIALALLGEGRVWQDGQFVDAAAYGSPLDLGLRDALGFISSGALTAGHAALLTVDARGLLRTWLAVAALSFEVLGADPAVLDERVQAARGAPGQAAVAAHLRALLADGDSRAPRAFVQDPFAVRVVPQVDGVTVDALARLDEVLGRELNAASENALIVEGEVLPNGNFHAGELAAALDAARLALASSASLIAARVATMLDARFTGLPRFLARREGIDSGMMMVEDTAQAVAAEVRSLAMPVAAQAVTASLGVESHASLATTAARRLADMLAALPVLVACELAVAVRALELAGRTAVGPLYETARAVLPTGGGDRRFGRDIEAALGLVGRLAAGEALGAPPAQRPAPGGSRERDSVPVDGAALTLR